MYHSSHQSYFIIIAPSIISSKKTSFHFSPSSHSSFNLPPVPLIEFRLVNNIDTLISKRKCINARCQNSSSTRQTVFNLLLFWHFEWCLRLTVKPSMEKHIALHSQPLSQSSTYQQLPEPCCIWMQPPLAQQWPIWWLISSSVMRLWRTSQSASALRQCGTHVCQPLSSATTTMYILQKPHSGRKSPLLENCLQVDDTVAQPPTVPCSLLLLLSAVPSFGLELQLWKFPLSLKICREGHTSSFPLPVRHSRTKDWKTCPTNEPKGFAPRYCATNFFCSSSVLRLSFPQITCTATFESINRTVGFWKAPVVMGLREFGASSSFCCWLCLLHLAGSQSAVATNSTPQSSWLTHIGLSTPEQLWTGLGFAPAP